jgi:hypothetical protein
MGSCSRDRLKLNERRKIKFNADDAPIKGTKIITDLLLTNDRLKVKIISKIHY